MVAATQAAQCPNNFMDNGRRSHMAAWQQSDPHGGGAGANGHPMLKIDGELPRVNEIPFESKLNDSPF